MAQHAKAREQQPKKKAKVQKGGGLVVRKGERLKKARSLPFRICTETEADVSCPTLQV